MVLAWCTRPPCSDFSDVPTTCLCRFVIDVATNRVSTVDILASGAQLDHPRVHPRYDAVASRFVYATCGTRRADELSVGADADAALHEPIRSPRPTQSFVCVDLGGGAEGGCAKGSGANGGGAEGGEIGEIVDQWHAGARRIVDEATLVARGPGERDAWLIAPVFDGATRTTSYVVLDAANLAAGPVCELPLPTHIPWGLHGAWTDALGDARAHVAN